MVKVSVIVPIYNSEKYLKRCIDSLVSQTLDDIEFVLINDGSTDSCDSIISSYSDSRIKYFKRSNHGIGDTRNFGIAHSCGDFIGFLDSDDYVESNMYENLYNKCIHDDLDIVICDFYKESSSVEKVVFDDFGITDLNSKPNLLMDINLAPWNKLYKRDICSNVLYPTGVKYEDTPWVAKVMSNASRIGILNECLYHYIVHSNSETTVVDNRVYDIFKITDILLSDLGSNECLKDSINDLVIYLITKYTVSQRYLKSKKDRDKFIDYAFSYLDKNVPNFRDCSYFKKRNFLKGLVEKSKVLTKIHCDLYSFLKN